MEIIQDSTAVLNNMSNSFDKFVNKMDFFWIDLPVFYWQDLLMLGQKSLSGKLGIAFVFYDVNNDICSDLEIKTPVLFFFSFLLSYRILGFLNF